MSQEVLAPTLRLLGARENPVGLKSSCWVPAVISTFVGSAFSPGFPTPLAPPLLLVCSLRLEPSSQDWGILTLGVHAAGREPKRPGTGGRTGKTGPCGPLERWGVLNVPLPLCLVGQQTGLCTPTWGAPRSQCHIRSPACHIEGHSCTPRSWG